MFTCLFIGLFVCLRPTHRLFMGRTLTATRTDAMTHPWGPEPHTHSVSQFSISDWHNSERLRRMCLCPRKTAQCVRERSWGRSSSVHSAVIVRRWICPGRRCSVRVIFPEWFTASALCWQQRGIRNTQQTRHCRLQAWSHHALSGLPGFLNKTRPIATLGGKIHVFLAWFHWLNLHFRG